MMLPDLKENLTFLIQLGFISVEEIQQKKNTVEIINLKSLSFNLILK